MKHITKVCFCLLCVMGVFLCSSISLAASSDITRFSITTVNQNSSTVNAELINEILPSTEDNRSNTTAVYEVNLNPMIQVSMIDGYLNGYVRYLLSCTVGSISQGVWYVDNWDIYFNQTNFDSYYHSMRYRTANAYDGLVYFDNYWPIGGTASNVTLGRLTIRVTLHDLQGAYPPASIPVNVNGSIEAAYYNFTANPVTQNQGGVIKQAILDALQQYDFDSIYSLLNFWKTTQDGYLADIELSLHDIELDNDTIIQWLSYINTVQISQDQKLELIRQLINTFPSYSSQVLLYMQQILSMNASQAAQAASNAVAQATQAQQASQAMAAANDFAKPDIGAMNIDPMDYVSADGFSGVSYILGSILNIPTILSMLLICVTCAFIGYALYGKKG